MDYRKLSYQEVCNSYITLSNEYSKIQKDIHWREDLIAKRIVKERLIEPGYDYAGCKGAGYSHKDSDNIEFTFIRDSGYETYTNNFYVPISVLDDPINKLDEFLKPYIEKRDAAEAQANYDAIKKEYHSQRQKLDEYRTKFPHIKFDD